MLVILAIVAGCAIDDKHPSALHGRWERTVVYPSATLHTELYLKPDGALTHTVRARVVADGDTILYTATANGQWYMQRTVSEFRILQALYDPTSMRRHAVTSSTDTIAAERANEIILRCLPPAWDSFDSYLMEPTIPTRIPYPTTLLEVTDTTTSLIGLGAYSTPVVFNRPILHK